MWRFYTEVLAGLAAMANLTFEKFFADYQQRLIELHELSGATTWKVPLETFAWAVWEGVHPAASLDSGDIPALLKKIRTEELALALACAQGNDHAWEAFSFGYRTAVYEAACAFASDLSMARDLTDSLTTELYGLETEDGKRVSKLSYFHGRSSLKTWLRALVYQKFVDEYRHLVRLAPLPDDLPASSHNGPVSGKDEQRYAQLLGEAVSVTLRGLSAREKVLLGFYYVQQLTLKQIGRITGEHEATVSRHMDAIRRKMRKQIENYLRKIKKLTAFEIDRCLNFESRGVLLSLDRELKSE